MRKRRLLKIAVNFNQTRLFGNVARVRVYKTDVFVIGDVFRRFGSQLQLKGEVRLRGGREIVVVGIGRGQPHADCQSAQNMPSDSVVFAVRISIAEKEKFLHSISFQSFEKRAVGGDKIHLNRHLTDGVRRTRETGVVSADGGFDAIERAFGNVGSVNVSFRHAIYGGSHRPIIMPGRNDEVDASQPPVLVRRVIVDESPARRFENADSAPDVIFARIENFEAGNIFVFA